MSEDVTKEESTAEKLDDATPADKEIPAEEIKSAMVFMCAVSPDPIVEIEKIVSVKTRQGVWLPAVKSSVIRRDGRELTAKFPIFCMEAHTDADLEELRKTLHVRVDGVIAEHKKRWAAAQKAAADKAPKKTVREMIKSVPKEGGDE